MRRQSIDALLISTQANYRYLCGHRSVQFAIDTRPMMLALALDSEPVLMIYGAEVADARAQTWVEDVTGYGGLSISATAVATILRDLGLAGARIGCELGPSQRLGITQPLFHDIAAELPETHFVDGSGVLDVVRMVKSVAEIARIEAACRIAVDAFVLIADRAHAGLSVEDCELMCVRAMIDAGADVEVRPVVSFGSLPKDHVFRPSDVFQVDLALAHRGYRADMTRRAVFGRPSDQSHRDHEQIAAIQAAVLASMRPGTPAASIARAFDEQVTRLGYPPLAHDRWIGHGIGLDLLERPSLDSVDLTPLEPGMVLTPEPWFLSTGVVVMVEETVLITRDGCRVLTEPASGELVEISS